MTLEQPITCLTTMRLCSTNQNSSLSATQTEWLKLAGGGVSLAVHSEGSVRLKAGDGTIFELKDCIYVPELTKNLISGGRLRLKGVREFYDPNENESFSLVVNGLALFNGYIGQNGLINVAIEPVSRADSLQDVKSNTDDDSTLQHRRLGHIGNRLHLRSTAMMDALTTLHASSSPAKKAKIFGNFYGVSCTSSANLKTFLAEIRSIDQQLTRIGFKMDSEVLAYFTLSKLPSELDSIRSALLFGGKEVTLKFVLDSLEQTSVSTGPAVVVKAESAMVSSSDSGRPRCTNCKRLGHLVETCYRLHPHLNPRKEKATVAEQVFMAADIIDPSLTFLDSGTTSHMFNNIALLKDPQPCSVKIGIGKSGQYMSATHIGTVLSEVVSGRLSLQRSFFVPKLSRNLLCYNRFFEKGYYTRPTTSGRFEITNGQHCLLTGTVSNNLFYPDISFSLPAGSVSLVAHGVKPSTSLWHNRLGHPNSSYLSSILPRLGSLTDHDVFCGTYALSKSHRHPFMGSLPRPSFPLDVIHSDLSGKISPPTISGYQYYMKITDGCTSYRYLYLLRHKNEAFPRFKEFATLVENFHSRSIKKLVSDGGGEYVNREFSQWLVSKGIAHQVTAPYTPQQTGISERGNGITVERARCLLTTAGMPARYWGEAVVTALYLENRLPCKTIGLRTPYELWHGQAPNYTHIRMFGCTAFIHVPNHKRLGKFSPTAARGVLLGYCEGTRNYRVLDPVSLKVTVSHDVSFDEDLFPFSSIARTEHDLQISELFEDEDSPEVGLSAPPQRTIFRLDATPIPVDSTPAATPPSSSSSYDTARTSQSTLSGPGSPGPPVNTSRPSRDRRAPERYGEFGQVAFLSDISPPGEPLTYLQALSSPDSHLWKEAMNQELQSLEACKTWSLVPLPKNKHCIGGKWVFKLKYKSDGTIDRYKARFVAKGFSQIPGLEFGDTYEPTGRLGSLRLLFAMATRYDWEVDQLDVVTAFLNGNLEEEIYMSPPPGLEGSDGLVCHLHQTLYGLRQAPNRGYHRLSTWLLSIGFVVSQDDPCLFLKTDPVSPCFLWLHVDDIAVFGRNIDWFKTAIKAEFKMVDHRPAHFLLGIRIIRDRSLWTLSLLQDRYLLSLLKLFDMTDC